MIGLLRDFYAGMVNGLLEVWAHKFRSLLSMLGIILGVAALVAMVGVVQGMIGQMSEYFERTGGINRLIVEEMEPPDHQRHIAHLSPGMTFNDVLAIRSGSPFTRYLDPEVNLRWSRFIAGSNRYNAPLRGVLPDRIHIMQQELREGRFISDLDIELASPVIVLGSDVADRLFPEARRGNSIIGRSVNVRGQLFTIIGVLEDIGGEGEASRILRWFDRVAYIPITTAMKRMNGHDRIDALSVHVADVSLLEDSITQIENILIQTHRGVEDFQVRTMEEQLAEFRKMERTFTFSLGGVAGISLLVGGIGIMNVMLAVINERIREIGVRKAIGARGHDIFIQFLAESVVISLVGGLIGMAVSVGFVELLRTGIQEENFRIVLSFPAMLFGFAFSATIGVLSGIYPAMKAASMNVIDALRYE